MATIGLDVGTTGCKASILDNRGNIVSQDYCEHDLIFPREGWVELEPEMVWESAKTVLSNVARLYPGLITAMSIASFGEAAALLDKDNNVTANSIFFTDVRGNEFIDELDDRLGHSYVEEVTGMPVNGMYTLMKLMWIKKNQPEIFERINMILPFGSYIGFRLTGEMASDYSLASRTLMYNRHIKSWEKRILDQIGLLPESMPQLVPSGQPIGRISRRIADEIGIPHGILLVSGAHDQVAAAIGAGAVEPGEAADGIGSAECITAVLPPDVNLKALHKHNICAEPHAAEGKFVSLTFSNTAGAALKWYRDCFERETYERLKAEGKNIYSFLEGTMEEEPSPLLFLPHLSGTGTPYMDANAKGILCGITLNTTNPQIFRAIIEGMNYEMRYNLELLKECGMKLEKLTAVGGGASSRDVLKIKADILQLPINTLENPQSGTIGLAMLCAVAEGKYADIKEAVDSLVVIKETIYPDSKYLAEYNEKYEHYSRMYAAGRFIYGR
jgi:xylulokinase